MNKFLVFSILFFLIIQNVYAGEIKVNNANIEYDILVDINAEDNPANKIFNTVQEAVDAVLENNYQRVVIFVKKGHYREHVNIKKNRITLIGESRDETIIDAVERRATVVLTGNEFYAKNITFNNPFGQEERYQALKTTSDRSIFKNCAITAGQDTLYIKRGRLYFYRSLIAGDVDFIYGDSAAVFEECEIRSVEPDGGYLTAASTPEGQPGYLFLNSVLTADPGVRKSSVYLGRPWRDYAQVTFINTRMGGHIKAVGWMDWGKPWCQETSRFEEYNSMDLDGNKLDFSQRVDWAEILTDVEVYHKNAWNYLKGNDGWDPTNQGQFYKEIEAAAANININRGNYYVIGNLDLPVNGINGTKIRWYSSIPDVISSDGIVNRPAAGQENIKVRLTAVITKNDRGTTRDFEFLVLKKSRNK